MATSEEGRRFVVGRCVGSGGFGEVYRATMTSGGGVRTEVALKVLHAGLDPRSQAVQRLADEAKLLGILSHPSILRIHDLVLLEGRIALVTEFVDGADLDECLADPSDPLPPRALFQAVAQVAAALQSAFDAPGADGAPLRLLHRDIKPSNIRIGRHGEVKLLDFGIAKAAGERIAKTQTNALIGSFAYMSPERLDREADHDPSGDVFSLGVTLAEALTGRRVFDLTVKEIYRIAMDERRHTDHIAAFLAGVPVQGAVRTLLEGMLAYPPGDRPRFPDVAEVLEDAADQAEGLTLARWCRQRTWASGPAVEGELSGRSISESRLSAEVLDQHLAAQGKPPPRGELSERTFAFDASSAPSSSLGPGMPSAPAFRAETEGTASPRSWGWAVGLVALLVGAAGAGALAASLGVVGWWFMVEPPGDAGGDPQPDPVPIQVDPAEPAPAPDAGEPEPTPAPVPTPGTPSPSPPPSPVADPGSLDRCGDPLELERRSLAGQLGPAAACIEGLLGDGRMAQTDRAKLGHILIQDTWHRCVAGSCADYERSQRLYFEEVTRSEAELVFVFSGHLASVAATDAQRVEAFAWCDRALELKSQWTGPTHTERVGALLERRARLAYARFEAQPTVEKIRVAARNAAVDWMNQRASLGLDPGDALTLCASAEGSEAACRSRSHDVGATFVVTLLSLPMGATVYVDGRQIGPTPATAELSAGAHELRMVTDEGVASTHRIEVELEGPRRWKWTVNGDEWVATQ